MMRLQNGQGKPELVLTVKGIITLLVLTAGVVGSFVTVQVLFNAHASDDGVHMPLERKVQMFQTRAEAEAQNEAVRRDLSRIEIKQSQMDNKLDRLLER